MVAYTTFIIVWYEEEHVASQGSKWQRRRVAWWRVNEGGLEYLLYTRGFEYFDPT